MNLAFCIDRYFPYGGREQSFLNIAQASRDRGFQVKIYAADWKGDRPAGLQIIPVPVRGMSNHRRILTYAMALKAIIRPEQHDLIIGFKGIREGFTSEVTLNREAMRIDVAYRDGPFKYLNNHWIFNSVPGGGCEIDFFVDFELRSRLLQKIIGMLFNEAVRRMVAAFESRADELYGRD